MPAEPNTNTDFSPSETKKASTSSRPMRNLRAPPSKAKASFACRHVRGETWDKIYPVLRPYLTGPEESEEPPVRIGRAYRRHPDLSEMFSDQKILLDAFDVLPDERTKQIVGELSAQTGPTTPTTSTALSPVENQLMGGFLKLSEEERKTFLDGILKEATEEVRRRRSQLF